LLAGLLVLAAACNWRRPDPRVSFERIQLAFLHGDLVRARAQAHKAYQQFSPNDPEWAWKFRLLEAEVMTDQGLSQDVLSLLNPEPPQALAGGDSGVQRQMLRALAFAHLGDFRQADQNLDDALRRCDHWNCDSAGKLARIGGAVEVDQNRADQAETYFRTSMRIARQRGDRFLEASAQLNLGVIAIGKEHFDESIDWSDQAQAAARAISAGLDEEKALGNLGWAYYKLGDFERSLEHFTAAAARARDSGAVKDETIWLNNLGLVNFQTNQLAVAEKYYIQSLDLGQKTQNSERTLASLTALAFLYIKSNRLNQAMQYSQQAFELAHRMGDRSDELYALLAEGKIAAATSGWPHAEQLFQEVARDPNSDTSLRWEAEHSLAKLFEHEDHTNAAERQYRQALATIENARSSIQHEDYRLPFLSNATHLYDDYIHFLVARGKTTEALQQADYSRAQTLAEGLDFPKNKPGALAPRVLDPQRIAKNANSTILFYWLGLERSYLWAVTATRTMFVQLPPGEEIDAAVERYRKTLVGPRDPLDAANGDASSLYRILVQPVRALIPQNSRVIIIPDGSLDNLNFETLLVPGPTLHYWIEDATVVTANSLRLLAASRPAPASSTGKLLLIGDPVAPNSDYGELPKASLEIENIEKHFSPEDRRVYAREQATASAFMASGPERFSFIHFVAHGTASRLSPLDSAVVLSQTTAGEDSFKLYARDIIHHPLRAELVTVSTCYGAGTRFYTGEGLVGLSWAFLRAGAHNVVGTLWEVSDVSTPQLMDEFYGELKKGRTPDVALRLAKLSLLHSDGVFRKPFYWAPFQLYTGS
jgi:CHAT domain-containing protein/Tfp pilus assembly protein PilF